MDTTKTNSENSRMSNNDLRAAVAKLSEILHDNLEKEYLEKKAKQRKVRKRNHHFEITNQESDYLENITNKFDQHTKDTLNSLDDLFFDPTQRNNNLAQLVNSVMDYPVEKVTGQIKQISKKQELEYKTILCFIKNSKNALLKIVFQHLTEFDELILEQLYFQEIENLELNYLLQNQSLQILNPNKYKSYLEMINTSIIAFYTDFRSFKVFESPNLKIIEKFFDTLLQKIETVSKRYFIEFEKTKENTPSSPLSFPNHIFSNLDAYQIFKESEEKANTAEDIGFLFRFFSEKARNPLIITTETPFRNWYNTQIKYSIKLNKPIKTLARIGTQDKKIKMIPNYYFQ